jgi:hypothetical protein
VNRKRSAKATGPQRAGEMTPNKKLTNLIRGRTIQEFWSDVSGLSVGFSDGSVLFVKGKEATDQRLKEGSTIASIFEQGNAFVIACEDQSRLSLELAESGSSVSVRESDGKVEYLG